MTEPIISVTTSSGERRDAAPAESPADLCGLDEAALRQVVALTLARAGVTEPVEVSIVITDDATIQALNRDYRGRDEVTDVLSFPLLDKPLVAAPADELWSRGGEADGEAENGASEDRDEPDRDGQHDPTVVSYAQGSAHADAAEDEVTFATPADLPRHLGDVVVARGATVRQAAQAGHSPGWELAYLVVHGVLHLIGYDDHTDSGYAAMVAHQEAVLREAGIRP